MSARSTEKSKRSSILLSHFARSLSNFGVFRKQKDILLNQKLRSLSDFGVFRKQKGILLSHFGRFSKQYAQLLIKFDFLD
ncbi:hypothetical protein [Dendronalium sp. ChiSLP03b]|uniref:hypothetical protein n=1 Tax=Dendronalium sp. ChiSLP03b TaxID=3075381 RepID=UPI002AD52C34|nr:hypothetical protein [Dendronalium sp. ChiSLP03b]MDZ8208969.1 hypothetical protein [Dendronalium sp. ChiSLP03b]